MTATLRGARLLALTAATPLLLGLAACGAGSGAAATPAGAAPSATGAPAGRGGDAGTSETDNGEAEAEDATRACPVELTRHAGTPLPADLPAPAGARGPYEYVTQGATKVWYLALRGTPDDLVRLRDRYDAQLKAHGYDIEGTDQEAGAEAESEFKGPHEGTTNLRPVCRGHVALRLKLTS